MLDSRGHQRRWTFITLVILVLAVAWTIRSRSSAMPAAEASQYAPRKGFYAPDFTLELLGGGEVTLSALRGKVVVVNLWASWCLPCRAEMPAFEQVHRAYQNLDVVILGVNATNQDSVTNAQAFVDDHHLTFPIPLDRDGEMSQAYGLRGLPSTYFIDRAGIIRSVIVGGALSEATIQAQIEELLKEAP